MAMAQDEPLRTDDELEERAKVRVQSTRIRIEPGYYARPGECLGVGVEDLRVKLRGERIDDSASVRLEREPQRAVHALLIDTSGSMFGRLEHARAAASEYVRRLRPGLDRAMVATFDETVILVEGLTEDRERLIEGIQGVRMAGTTSMIDALYYSMLELRTQRGRPVILVLTDGVDSASLYERHHVYDLVKRTPELSVFTIGVSLPYASRGGPSGVNSTKRFLQRLSTRTNGKFFDVPTSTSLEKVYLRVREMLESEATLSVVDPDPEADPGKLKISSRRENCRIRVFKKWDAPPDDDSRVPLPGATGVLPGRVSLPPFEYYSSLRSFVVRPLVDPACSPIVDPAHESDPAWYAEVDKRQLRGCMLDVTLPRGLLYEPYRETWVHSNAWIAVKTRPFEVPLPMVGGLPTTPVSLMEALADMAVEAAGRPVRTDPRLVPAEAHARPYHDLSLLADGAQFLEMRAHLARALYMRSDYREWVLERLRLEADAEIAALDDLYARRFPDIPVKTLRQVVAGTEEAKEIRSRARTPAQIDIQAHLGAWLGDIAAHDLFVEWETELVNRALASNGQFDFDAAARRWTAVRNILFVPSYSRVLALLSPGYDPDDGRVGYWRVVLPRPVWLQTRVKEFERDIDVADLPLDLIPERPYGLWVMETMQHEHDDVLRAWREAGYRVRSSAYQLTGEDPKNSPEHAYDDHRVTLVLRSDASGDTATLFADITLEGKKKTPVIQHLHW